jgi:hypothetical protein
MKIYCKELDKSFDTKEQLFKALVDNEKLIIDAKKSQVFKSFEKGLEVCTDQNAISKAFQDETKGIKFDENYYYFVVNSANILDSHGDMHVDGNWNKSVKEQQGKVYLVFDHSLKRNDIIAMPKDIEMFTAKVPFSLLGKNYEGETYSLIYKVSKEKIVDKKAKEWLEKGYNLQASVRMQYVKIETAINSNNPDYSKQKANFDEYYDLIANKSDLKEIDYFYIVKEAKNIMESSLVLFGSNQATGEISNNKSEADKVTPETPEPPTSTQPKKKRIFINTQKN